MIVSRNCRLLLLVTVGLCLGRPAAAATAAEAQAIIKNAPALTTDVGAAVPDFYFEFEAGSASGVMPKIKCARTAGKTGVLTLIGEKPTMFGADGFVVGIDPGAAGALAVTTRISPLFILRPTQNGMDMSFGTGPENADTRIDLELGALLVAASKVAKSEAYDPVRRIYSIQTEHALFTCTLAKDAKAYPIESLEIKSADRLIRISNCRTTAIPHSLTSVTLDDIKSLHVPMNELQSPRKMENDISGGKMDDALSAKLATLFVDAIAPSKTNATFPSNSKTASLLDNWIKGAQDAIATHNALKLQASLSAIGNIIDSQVVYPLVVPKPNEMNGRYDRKIASEKLADTLGLSGASQLTGFLVSTSLDAQLGDEFRCEAILDLGDIGMTPEQLKQLDAGLKGELFRAALASVQVRLGIPPAEESLLAKAVENRSLFLPVRLACLEALSWSRDAKLPQASIEVLAQANEFSVKRYNLREYRATAMVAQTKDGFNQLCQELERPTTSLDRRKAIGALALAAAAESPDFARLREICEKLVVAPDVSDDLFEGCVFDVLMKSCSDATVSQILKAAIAAQKPDRISKSLMLVRQTQNPQVFLDLLESIYDKGDQKEKVAALISLMGKFNLKLAPDYSSSVELLGRGLAEKDTVVRGLAFTTLANLKVKGATGLDPLKAAVESHITPDLDLQHGGKIILFALEKMTNGAFTIKDMPRDSNGWLAQGAEADKWWQDNFAKTRDAAIAWIKANPTNQHQ